MNVYVRQLANHEGETVQLRGWNAQKRDSKGLVFMVFRDGTGFCQAVIDVQVVGEEVFEIAKRLPQESSLSITGKVVKDERQIGGYEIHVTALEVIAEAEPYPITPKEHGVDFLMDHRHLWLRSRRQWAIMRVRNRIIFAIHEFFQSRGFIQMDAPIFTGNACEGTTTLFETDFYGEPAYLSQSGQLYGEAMAMAHGLIYTFGPTFRAEKSKTRRHLSEFWMIEPEMAFYDLQMDMDLIEDFIRYVVTKVLEDCKNELQILERDTTYLEKVREPFVRIKYEDAVRIIKGEVPVSGRTSFDMLEEEKQKLLAERESAEKEIAEREAKIKSGTLKKGEVNFNQSRIDKLKAQLTDIAERLQAVEQWIHSARNFVRGNDFGGGDETVLTKMFGQPVMVYNWPQAVKAFYMKEDEQEPGYAKGVDLLAPEGYGEIVGGGERETDLEKLKRKIQEHQLPMSAFEWYLDLRRFGNVPHSGFGLGLERLVAWICGLQHIRETIPFPRSYGRLLP
ncbi:MAG: asparagine--tRNA ligase [Chitinophagales bacterium]|nr:asparagine--tRNA ligase [Chitinophagales bacterium]MDW8419813.1 asparagine--tRNA ligase [Chitinophagales bacterium]